MSEAVRATSLAEAIEALAAQPDLRPIAGCTDLMVAGPVDRADLGPILDLTAVAELSGIEERGETVTIGATTTFTEIRHSPVIRRHLPALADAAAEVGGWQIQNRATLGGNVANASPAGDSLPVLLALAARVVLIGPEGQRELRYDDFHTGYRATALGSGEIVERFDIPVPRPGAAQGFRKVGTREAQAISKVVAAHRTQLADGHVTEIRLAAGSVAAVPVRLRGAEAAATGLPLEEAAEAAAREAGREVTPIDDVRSTAAYRRYVLGRVVRRLLLGAGGEPSGGSG